MLPESIWPGVAVFSGSLDGFDIPCFRAKFWLMGGTAVGVSPPTSAQEPTRFLLLSPQPGSKMVSSAKAAVPTVSDQAAAMQLSQCAKNLATSLAELRTASQKASGPSSQQWAHWERSSDGCGLGIPHDLNTAGHFSGQSCLFYLLDLWKMPCRLTFTIFSHYLLDLVYHLPVTHNFCQTILGYMLHPPVPQDRQWSIFHNLRGDR